MIIKTNGDIIPAEPAGNILTAEQVDLIKRTICPPPIYFNPEL